MVAEIKSIDQLINEAKTAFRQQFKDEPNVAVYAPGRVNLIGEHTDYNDGFVMPMALPLVTVIVGKKMTGNDVTIYTTFDFENEEKQTTFELPQPTALIRAINKDGPKWAVYVKGVIANYIGNIPSAFNAVIHSSVPLGGGLSSSAALEVATYTFLDQLTSSKTKVSVNDKALACQKAEHEYAGVPCGIMDQFISFMGKEGHALLIDCRHLTSILIPFSDQNVVILITNSNVKHELTGSEYSSRRKQCEEAAMLLKKVSLRDANMDDIKWEQEKAMDKELRRAYKSNLSLTVVIEDLKEQLKKQRKELEEQLDEKLKIVEMYNEKIQNVRENFELEMGRTLRDSEKEMMYKTLESEEKQHVLAEEAEKIVKHYEDVLRTNLQQEDSSRAKRSKIETQLQNWINTFDQDIGEKQAQFDLLQEEYDKKKAEIDEVQKIIDEQEEEYDILMAEKEEEEERLFNEMAYQFFLDRSARKIQKYWRAYMEKKASRKKKGKKKK
ncbi:galactokinase-like isoform X1 [Diorhabda carinulata]|uniref:galactokinase-like isoform X1 n=1 Tax=Diorhabda carinulata TaxID=1163345 RepID=UPI0025A2FD98|nr:galactokinase-like isoform X1 [Diorhabda carinulata]XP_057659915.1 galactokinase-like isoform X1 [Diorhabda carinulata]